MMDSSFCHGRIWDTLLTKVPIEKAYLGHMDLLPRSLDHNAILWPLENGEVSSQMQVSHILVFNLYSIVISVPDP